MGALGAASGSPSAPGKNVKRVWKLQTYAGETLAQHVIKDSIDLFNRIAGDEMRIDLYYADQLVPTGDLFRALKDGEVDLIQGDDASMGSPADVAVFSGYFPFGCRYSLDLPALFNRWGLNRIWTDAYRKEEGVTWLGSGAWDPCHLITKEPLESLDDLDKLRVVTFPTAEDFLARFGVRSVQLRGDEVIPALKFGEINGVAWSGITENYEMDWYLHLDYFLASNISGAWLGSYFANSKKWDSLPDRLKRLFLVCMDSSHYYRQHWYWGGEAALRVNGKGTKKFKITSIPKGEWDVVELEAHNFWNEVARISAQTKEVIDILRSYNNVMLKAGAPYN